MACLVFVCCVGGWVCASVLTYDSMISAIRALTTSKGALKIIVTTSKVYKLDCCYLFVCVCHFFISISVAIDTYMFPLCSMQLGLKSSRSQKLVTKLMHHIMYVCMLFLNFSHYYFEDFWCLLNRPLLPCMCCTKRLVLEEAGLLRS